MTIFLVHSNDINVNIHLSWYLHIAYKFIDLITDFQHASKCFLLSYEHYVSRIQVWADIPPTYSSQKKNILHDGIELGAMVSSFS